jgi:peptidoglycan hydrolase CwlO-like protein
MPKEGDTRTVSVEEAEIDELKKNGEELASTIKELREEREKVEEKVESLRTSVGRLAEQNRVYQEQLAAIAPILARYSFELEEAVRSMRANAHTH